jgi:hypothetical protein
MIKSLAILFFIVGISSCGGGDDDKRYKFLETILVSGTCWEDHVNIKDKYSGFVVRKYDNKEKRVFIRGEVNDAGSLASYDSISDMMYKYKVPSEIEFQGIPIEIFNKNKLVLKGNSRHYPKYTMDEKLQNKVVLMYYSTCDLEVTKRMVF